MKNRIKEIRESKHMTKRDLAEKCGVCLDTINRLESRNVPKNVYISTLQKLAKGLDVPVGALLA